MAFCITFGTHEFSSQLKGYEGITAQCRNCGNWSAHCISRWPWFTVCFIPVLPLATHKYSEVKCPVCNFHQDLRDRPDVAGMQGQQGGQQGGAPPPQGGPNQGWGGQQGGGGGGGGGAKPQYH